MPYYRRRRRSPNPSPPIPRQEKVIPVEVDMATLLQALQSANAPTHRCLTVGTITPTIAPSRYYSRYSWNAKRSTVLLYDGRNKVQSIPADTVVTVEPQAWGWRITVSKTGEPTPSLLTQSTAPTNSNKLTEISGYTIYQTPDSILTAALYHHSKNRRDLTLALLDEAIDIKVKAHRNVPDDVKDRVRKAYTTFTNLSAYALGTANDKNNTDAIENEAAAAYHKAVPRGVKLITQDWR